MFKYLVASLAAIYSVLLIFGDEDRRPDVARKATDEITGVTLASFQIPSFGTDVQPIISDISDAEAIDIALKAAEDHRATRDRTPLRGMIAAIETPESDTIEASQPMADLWYVTGTTVNLRAGPGTGNAVVGQVVEGEAAEVLSGQDGWYQIRTADGGVEGWIFGRFLSRG
jgi:hypothetical protein